MAVSRQVPTARTPLVHLILGLPAAGKTTLAHELHAQAGGMMRRISLSELRAMLDPARPDGLPLWSDAHEQTLRSILTAVLREVVVGGYDAVIDDTDITPATAAQLKQAVGRVAWFVVHDLTGVPVEECIARDAARPRPVGADVIRLHAQQYADAVAAGRWITEQWMNDEWDKARRGAAWARAHAPRRGEDEAA